mgnify:CR=1 FL=1|jgi:hypothetical protein
MNPIVTRRMPVLREIAPPPDLQNLLDRYRAWGGRVDYVLLRGKVPPTMTSESLHHEAAVRFLEAMHHRRLRETKGSFFITFDADKARGLPISTPQFVGSSRDRRGFFDVFRQDPSSYAGAFCSRPYDVSPGREEVAAWRSSQEPPRASASPPREQETEGNYQQIARQMVQSLFEDINTGLFGDLNDSRIEVWAWSSDWSNYFDWESGYPEEAYLWTVDVPAKKWIVALGTSTSY